MSTTGSLTRKILPGAARSVSGLAKPSRAPSELRSQHVDLTPDVERELKETTEGYLEAKSSLSLLDGYIGHINAVLTNPEQQVGIKRVHMRVNLLGFKVDEPTRDEPTNELELTDLYIGDGQRATIALVRIPREEVAPKEDLLAQAERFL